MNKIVALLLAILFALSVLGCATTQERSEWHYNQSNDYKVKSPALSQNTSYGSFIE